MLYQNTLKSTMVLLNGKYRLLPKGYKDPRDQKPLDVADFTEEELKDPGVQSFIQSGKLVEYQGVDKEVKTTKTESKPVEKPEAPKSEVIKSGEGVTVVPKEKDEPVPDLTAGVDGKSPKMDSEPEVVETKNVEEVKEAAVPKEEPKAPVAVETIPEPKEELTVNKTENPEPKKKKRRKK